MYVICIGPSNVSAELSNRKDLTRYSNRALFEPNVLL